MQEQLKDLQTKALQAIRSAHKIEELDDIRRQYLGRTSQIRNFSLQIKNMSIEEKAVAGKLINDYKNILETAIFEKKNNFISFGSGKESGLAAEDLTIWSTADGESVGHLHLHTKTKNRVADIFHSMGFEILEGQEIEDEFYNFEALNIPAGHPARDMWDTFWLDQKLSQNRLLLRTHTSSMQVRVMEKRQPPLRICVIGKCYRHEATDAKHEHTLYQIEGFVVDKNISVANLIFTLQEFLHSLFGQQVEVRLRPSYFPFTEPSFEMDFRCLKCGGSGCPVCGQSGWLEMLGCGMIHPRVLSNAGYKPGQYTGFAFGIGLDRLIMMRHKIDDIRWFHSGDLRFIKQF